MLVAKPRLPPRIETGPTPESWEAAEEALLIAELGGLQLDDWQKYLLAQAMGRTGGKWSAFEVGCIVPRQNGKTELLLARILSALFTTLDDPRMTIFTSHEYKTSREVFNRLRFLLDPPRDMEPWLVADEELRAQVKTIRTANGEESVELVNGRRVRFLARTGGSGRGFTGDLVLLDEAYRLAGEQMAALLPTLSARPNPQVWYASMGPLEDSQQQLQVMERGRVGEDHLYYSEYSAPGDSSLDDEDWWLKANPAAPHRVTIEHIRKERRALGDEEFARERLSMRAGTLTAAIPPHLWTPAVDPNAAPAGRLLFGLDVSPERTHAAVAAADLTGTAEIIDYGPIEGLVDRVTTLTRTHGAPVAIDAGGPAASLITALEDADVQTIPYKGRDLANACARFYDRLVDRTIRVRSRPELEAAVKSSVKRTVGDAFVWGRRKTDVDSSPLLALTLAADAALNPPDTDPGLVFYVLDD